MPFDPQYLDASRSPRANYDPWVRGELARAEAMEAAGRLFAETYAKASGQKSAQQHDAAMQASSQAHQSDLASRAQEGENLRMRQGQEFGMRERVAGQSYQTGRDERQQGYAMAQQGAVSDSYARTAEINQRGSMEREKYGQAAETERGIRQQRMQQDLREQDNAKKGHARAAATTLWGDKDMNPVVTMKVPYKQLDPILRGMTNEEIKARMGAGMMPEKVDAIIKQLNAPVEINYLDPGRRSMAVRNLTDSFDAHGAQAFEDEFGSFATDPAAAKDKVIESYRKQFPQLFGADEKSGSTDRDATLKGKAMLLPGGKEFVIPEGGDPAAFVDPVAQGLLPTGVDVPPEQLEQARSSARGMLGVKEQNPIEGWSWAQQSKPGVPQQFLSELVEANVGGGSVDERRAKLLAAYKKYGVPPDSMPPGVRELVRQAMLKRTSGAGAR